MLNAAGNCWEAGDGLVTKGWSFVSLLTEILESLVAVALNLTANCLETGEGLVTRQWLFP